MAFRLPLIKDLLKQIPELNLFMVDYRGFGDSEGHPHEAGIKVDAQAALEYVQKHPTLGNNQIIVFGRSLGGAVAVDLVSNQKQTAGMVLIVENTFLDVASMATKVFPFLSPFSPLLKPPLLFNFWDSKSKVASIQCPVLLLSGAKDELIPQAHMRKLFALLGGREDAHFESFPTGTHNDTPMQAGALYYASIKRFLAKY